MNNSYGNIINPSQSPLVSGERYPYNLDQVNLWDYFRNTIESIAHVARKSRLRFDREGHLTKIKCGRLLVCNVRPEKVVLRTTEREILRILRIES